MRKSQYFPFWMFSAKRGTFVGSAWSFVFFIPATTANDLRLRRIFYPRFYQLQLFSYLNSWERASIFPFECSVLNEGTTGTIFITYLVWRGPWPGIEPGTSRTRSKHYTTKAIEAAVQTGQWYWMVTGICFSASVNL